MNNENIKRTKDALNIWLKRCDDREEKIWYIDQLELCRLCEDTINPKELINQLPERKSEHSSEKFTIKTFHFTKYNFLPSSPTPYEGTNRKEAKIIHFKGEWRKKMFELTPSYFRGFIPYTVLSFWGNQHRVIKLILKMFRILNKIYP